MKNEQKGPSSPPTMRHTLLRWAGSVGPNYGYRSGPNWATCRVRPSGFWLASRMSLSFFLPPHFHPFSWPRGKGAADAVGGEGGRRSARFGDGQGRRAVGRLRPGGRLRPRRLHLQGTLASLVSGPLRLPGSLPSRRNSCC